MSSLLCGTVRVTSNEVARAFVLPILHSSRDGNAPMKLVIYRRGHTRSHSEHGSQALLSRWYS